MRRTPCGYTVSIYADRRELLVFRTFLQSASVSKRVFRHADAGSEYASRVIFLSYFTLRVHKVLWELKYDDKGDQTGFADLSGKHPDGC